jgi:hypothetical protein
VGILDTKTISELSPQDLKDLTKPLGVRGRPYPMRDTVFTVNSKGEKVMINRLGLLEDNTNPLVVYSDRAYSDVFGMAMREMPTPGMLPMFFDAIARRNPYNVRRFQFSKGAAGTGKTYAAELIGRMRSKEGALKIDCANLNLSELLYETVLDFSNDRSFYNELNKRLASGRANPLTIKILKENLGEAFHDDNGKVSVDWNLIGHNITDQDGKKMPSHDAVSAALTALRRVSDLEGLDSKGGNALGMATQEGALIRAFKEGREVILDEFNRGKKGTTGALHGVIQFIIGEIDECTVHNSLKEKGDDAGQSFTFRRSDMKPGFFVTATGNTEADGTDVEELPQSLSSRVIPQHVPVATQEDWQHRICQMLTGVPVSTIYYSAEDQWKKHPEGFRKFLADTRKIGETRPIPELEMKLLRRYEDVVAASEKLARFYYGWSEIVNPDSRLHRKGSLASLLEEIDDGYNREVTVDFRKIIAHINEAKEHRPTVRAPHESEGYDLSLPLDKAPNFAGDDNEPEELAQSFGTRLANVIVRQIVKDTLERGKPGLYNQLIRHAADCGLLESPLHEGMKNQNRGIASLLNDNPFDSPVKDVQAEVVRDLMCNQLRAQYPGLSPKNDDIMQVEIVSRALADLDESHTLPVADFSPVVFNDDASTVHRQPFMAVEAIDTTPRGQEDPNAAAPATPEAGNLVGMKAFIATLAAPGLRQHNLGAIWNSALTDSGAVANSSDNKDRDEGLAIAENNSATGLALTTVMVKPDAGAAKAVPLHVLYNSKSDRIVIVGEGALDKEMRKAFTLSRVTYIDRLEKEAGRKADNALSILLTEEGRKYAPTLKNAFLMRNMMPTSDQEQAASLGQLMTERNAECFLPHYLVRRNPA